MYAFIIHITFLFLFFKINFIFLFFKINFIYLFLERGEEKERERETSMCGCLSHDPYRGPDLARSPGMCPDLESNQRPFGSQACVQFTEPHQQGLINIFRF